MERIQKILSARGVCSRRQAEEWIKAGRVSCNGHICQLGDTADADADRILVDGNPLPSATAHVYIMLNKPCGFVTTLSDEKGRKNVTELVKDCNTRVYPVGRLDMDSEGLLLLTNDGEFANLLMHPRHEVNKTYAVEVSGFTQSGMERMTLPMSIDGHPIQKPAVTLVSLTGDHALLHITIHEGRNRQVRKMCAICGMQVRRLTRISEGAVTLGQLPKGKWRHLTDAEVAKLKEG